MNVLRMYWRVRGDKRFLQSGESVFDAILDHEFGAVEHSCEATIDGDPLSHSLPKEADE